MGLEEWEKLAKLQAPKKQPKGKTARYATRMVFLDMSANNASKDQSEEGVVTVYPKDVPFPKQDSKTRLRLIELGDT